MYYSKPPSHCQTPNSLRGQCSSPKETWSQNITHYTIEYTSHALADTQITTQERHLRRGRRARLRRDGKVPAGARRAGRGRVRGDAPDVVHGQLGGAGQPAEVGPGRGQGLLGVWGRQDTLGVQDGHRRVRVLGADGRGAAEWGPYHTGARAALVRGGEFDDCLCLVCRPVSAR